MKKNKWDISFKSEFLCLVHRSPNLVQSETNQDTNVAEEVRWVKQSESDWIPLKNKRQPI